MGAQFILDNKSKAFLKKFDKVNMIAVNEGAKLLQKLVRQRISTPWPPASRPNNPPHLRTGNLRRGIIVNRGRRFERRRWSLVGWSGRAIYGYYHEIGIDYARVGIQRRPHLVPTFRRNAGKIGRHMIKVYKRMMKKK